MPRKTTGILIFLFLATVSASSNAQIVIDNGGLNTISGPSGAVTVLSDGTTLVVNSPASVMGSTGIQNGAAIVGGAGTIINLLGGQVTGAQANGPVPPDGITSSGLFAAFGGSATGGSYSGGGGLLKPGAGVNVSGTAIIAGGDFQGGNGTGSLGLGGSGLASTSDRSNSSDVMISDGLFKGGTGVGAFGLGGEGLALQSNFTISGGTFQGGAGSSAGGTSAFFSLGQNGVAQTGTITGGTFLNGAGVIGGLGIFEDSRSAIDISGGNFNGSPLGHYIEGQLYNWSTLSFLGSQLSWTPIVSDIFGDNFLLTGTLLDGNTINLDIGFPGATVTETSIPQGVEITFQGVPEPSSVVMLGVGILGIALVYIAKRIRRSRVSRLAAARIK